MLFVTKLTHHLKYLKHFKLFAIYFKLGTFLDSIDIQLIKIFKNIYICFFNHVKRLTGL